jgi:bla regulator protein BlaR1
MNVSFLSELLLQFVRASVQASVLIGLVLLLRWAFGPSLAPRWRCALWLLVVARLAWPFSLPSHVSLFNLFNLPPDLLAPDRLSFHLPSAFVEQGIDWLDRPLVALIWAIMAVLMLGRLVAGFAWLNWRLRDARTLDNWEVWWLLQECKEVTGLRTPVAILESPHIKSPCLLGFLRPRLLLPAGLTGTFTREELRLVFLHELAHLKRRDIAFNWLLEIVASIHWFNPLVWMVCDRMRADREEACDACALARADIRERRSYGRALLKLIENFGETRVVGLPGVAGLLSGDDQLERRMHFILGFQPGRRTWVVGLCTFLTLAFIGFTDPPRPEAGEVIQLEGAIVDYDSPLPEVPKAAPSHRPAGKSRKGRISISEAASRGSALAAVTTTLALSPDEKLRMARTRALAPIFSGVLEGAR